MLVPFYSATRTFLQKFGFAFAWAALFGGVLGGMSYYRLPPAGSVEHAPWHHRLRWALESAERWFFDWRVRELGAQSERSDAVVLVTIDDETMVSARESTSLQLATQPWPRQLLGELFGQLTREGSELVVFDLPLTDLSPHPSAGGGSDDQRMRELLDTQPGRSLLTYGWRAEATHSAGQELHPYLLLLASGHSLEALRDPSRRILSARVPAYVIPQGQGVQLWAGASSEARAQELASVWGLKHPLTIRQRTAAEQAYEMPPWKLLASFASVQVDGLDPERLVAARGLEGPNPELLSSGSVYGGTTLVAHPDGKVRAIPHLIRYVPFDGPPMVLPSAPLAAAMQLAGSRELRYHDGRLLIGGKFSVPMDEFGFSLLRWDADESVHPARGSLKRAVSAWSPLVNLNDYKLKRGAFHHDNELEARVAIVTDATTRSGAYFDSPIGTVSGGSVLGQSLLNLLRSEGIRRSSPRMDLALTLVFALVGAVLAVAMSTIFRTRAGPLTYLLALAAAGGLYLLMARHMFVRDQRWIAVASPMLAMAGTFWAATGYAAALERRIREVINSALGQYVPPEVARLLQRDLALMRPEKKAVTVCFVDIPDFHLLADKLDPDKLGELLQEYFVTMTEVVHLSQGQLDKYIGDAVMAFWGAPVRLEAHAEAACEAVCQMQRALQLKQTEWKKQFGVQLEFRAGLNTGEVVVGEMGTRHKSNYTVIGKVVARAARYETLNRRYGTRVLVGEATARIAASRFVFREVDRIRSSTEQEVERLFELLGPIGALSEAQRERLNLFHAGLNAYHARRFEEGKSFFLQGAEQGDALCRVYAERCSHWVQHPPPPQWDGVFPEP